MRLARSGRSLNEIFGMRSARAISHRAVCNVRGMHGHHSCVRAVGLPRVVCSRRRARRVAGVQCVAKRSWYAPRAFELSAGVLAAGSVPRGVGVANPGLLPTKWPVFRARCKVHAATLQQNPKSLDAPELQEKTSVHLRALMTMPFRFAKPSCAWPSRWSCPPRRPARKPDGTRMGCARSGSRTMTFRRVWLRPSHCRLPRTQARQPTCLHLAWQLTCGRSWTASHSCMPFRRAWPHAWTYIVRASPRRRRQTGGRTIAGSTMTRRGGARRRTSGGCWRDPVRDPNLPHLTPVAADTATEVW